MNPLISISYPRPGDLPDPHAHMRVIRAPADVPAGRPLKLDHRTGATLADTVRILQVIRQCPLACGP